MSHTYTWTRLVQNATSINPASRGRNYPYTPKWEFDSILPFVGTKSCLVQLHAYGVTQPSMHKVTLLFGDCDIVVGTDNNLSLSKYFKVTYNNETYYIKKFDKNANTLTSRCTCKDYFFTFAWYNYYNGHCLYGPAPRPYQRKTTWMPPRNPRHIPGVCKHVYNAWEYLRQNGYTIN